jgi:hypothetical protein
VTRFGGKLARKEGETDVVEDEIHIVLLNLKPDLPVPRHPRVSPLVVDFLVVEGENGGDVVPGEGRGRDGEPALIRGRDEVLVDETDSLGWGDGRRGGEGGGSNAVHKVFVSKQSKGHEVSLRGKGKRGRRRSTNLSFSFSFSNSSSSALINTQTFPPFLAFLLSSTSSSSLARLVVTFSPTLLSVLTNSMNCHSLALSSAAGFSFHSFLIFGGN